ncbi:MAG TPA: hypothetical protein VMM15_33415 [Bradyrhizobium sp.]|nr:hypothetical protein [Bradyrhizobium sp.]
MRQAAISTLLLLQLCGTARAIDDAGVCGDLRNMGASGLYLAYPFFSPALAKLDASKTCDAVGGFCLVKPGRLNPFDDGARFYFVPAAIPRTEEGVWHIRTQTQARNLDGADQAYLARGAINTRCSPTQLLESFPGGASYVPVNDYIDHHAAGSDARPIREIGQQFHFEIQDPPGGPACIRTDSRRAFGDLSRIYGFADVARRQKRLARFLSFVGTAAAAPTPYAGLSSEFAYYDRPEPPCFGFAGPKPTRTEYLGESIDWKPYLTTIWIKRLRGREVTSVGPGPISVSWAP